MSFYIIISHKGWIRESISLDVKRFDSLEEAVEYPADEPSHILPVHSEKEFEDYMSGAKRTPILNKSGLR